MLLLIKPRVLIEASASSHTLVWTKTSIFNTRNHGLTACVFLGGRVSGGALAGAGGEDWSEEVCVLLSNYPTLTHEDHTILLWVLPATHRESCFRDTVPGTEGLPERTEAGSCCSS